MSDNENGLLYDGPMRYLNPQFKAPLLILNLTRLNCNDTRKLMIVSETEISLYDQNFLSTKSAIKRAD